MARRREARATQSRRVEDATPWSLYNGRMTLMVLKHCPHAVFRDLLHAPAVEVRSGTSGRVEERRRLMAIRWECQPAGCGACWW